MRNRRGLGWCWVATLWILGTGVGCSHGPTRSGTKNGLAAKNEPPASDVRTIAQSLPQSRDRIDQEARLGPLEPIEHRRIDAAGSVLAWAISVVPTPPAEEAEDARAFHTELARTHSIHEAPEPCREVLQRLVASLPPRMKPPAFSFAVHLIAGEEPNAFTPGGGVVYLTESLFDALQGSEERAQPMLAFVLGHELGHVCLGHTARGCQLRKIQQHLAERTEAEKSQVRKVLRTSLPAAGVLAPFLYSREQEYEADLFALQLCQRAGVDPWATLDLLRLFSQIEHTRLVSGSDQDGRPNRSALAHFFSSHPEPLHRLERLLMELEGRVEGEESYGLFAVDRTTRESHKAADGSLGGRKAIVLVHGMDGDATTYQGLLPRLLDDPGLSDRMILLFRYPNDGSLARSARLLAREMRRIRGSDEVTADFVCHSAGGLVFRCYAEVEQGPFRRTVFLGTPQHGADMAALRGMVEAFQLAGDAKRLGISEALSRTILDGRGQIAWDLRPESLFLVRLEGGSLPANRYVVFRGRMLGELSSVALSASFGWAKAWLQAHLTSHLPNSSPLSGIAVDALERLECPREFLLGDGVVTPESAQLAGCVVKTVPADHVALTRDPVVIREVLALLRGD